jgi:glycosyltransferase involved in cell wall biosynthesis
MRLSFVIPAHNEENYLPACLDSILSQVHELPEDLASEVEIIVVNNASSDRTGDVALTYPGIQVVNEPRKGLTYARQAGFLRSSGELIANVDSDSRLTCGWLNQVLDTFSAEPKLACLSGPFVYYDLTPAQRVTVQVFYCSAFLVYALNRWVLSAGSMVQGGNFVVRRSALEQIGGFNLGIAFYGEDTDIARRLHHVGAVRFTLALKMFSSARRLRKEGMLTVATRYTMNYLWTTFRKRPFTEEYVDIREQQPEGQPEG